MGTVREHLANFHAAAHEHHKAAAEHHTEKAAHHERWGKSFGSMAKAASADDGKVYQDVADTHHAAAKSHAQFAKDHAGYAEFHKSAAAECMKAHESNMNKIAPDNFSSVIPSDAPFGIRSVPRPGQPDLDLDKSAIPVQFRHLVEFGDEV